jgi:hypothetical protein
MEVQGIARDIEDGRVVSASRRSRICSCRQVLDHDGQSGNHENDTPGLSCQELVHETMHVTKGASYWMAGHRSSADFIRDGDQATVMSSIGERGGGPQDVSLLVVNGGLAVLPEEIGDPDRHAVDHYRGVGRPRVYDGRCDVLRLLDRLP